MCIRQNPMHYIIICDIAVMYCHYKQIYYLNVTRVFLKPDKSSALTYNQKLSWDQLRKKLYDKRDFDFSMVNFPFICSNIPAELLHIEYIYLSVDTIFHSYQDFFKRGLLYPCSPEGGYTVLPLSVLPSVQDIFRRIFLSNYR